MSAKRTQHKPERETPAKETSRLKKELQALKRQVVKLRKQVDQGVSTVPDVVEVEPKPKQPVCSECSASNIKTITTPSGKTFKVCANCRTRLNAA